MVPSPSAMHFQIALMQFVAIGEPIAEIPKDLNFLNMSPIEPNGPSVEDFLKMSPLVPTSPVQIPPRPSEHVPDHFGGSPPQNGMTVLPAPPRRTRNGTISEKDRERSSQSLADPTAIDQALKVDTPLEPVPTI